MPRFDRASLRALADRVPPPVVALLVLGLSVAMLLTGAHRFGRALAAALAAGAVTVLAKQVWSLPGTQRAMDWLGTPRRVLGLRFRPSFALLDVACVASLLFVAGIPLERALFHGQFPATHDHSAHAVKAWLMATHLFPRFSLTGWNHYLFSGDPQGDLYHILADVYIALVYKLSFGKLTFDAAYGLAVALHWLFTTSCVYVGGRRYIGRVGAFAAAYMFATDVGNWDCGWFWDITYGVWPQFFGLGFAMLSMGRLRRLMDAPSPFRVVLFALPLACGVLAHPIVALYTVPAVLFAVAIISIAEAKPLGRMALLVASGGVLAGGLIAFWQLPFQTLGGEWVPRAGMVGYTLDHIVDESIAGHTFADTHFLVNVLGLLGVFTALAVRDPGGLTWALHALLLLAFVTNETQIDLHLFDRGDVFRRIWYGRVFGVAKLSWELCAGYAVGRLAHAAWVHSAREQIAARVPWRRAVTVALVVLFAAPFVQLSGARLRRSIERDRSVSDFESLPSWRDYREVLKWTKTEWYDKEFARGEFFRVMWSDVGDMHQHMYLFAPIFNGLPAYKAGFSPAIAFKVHFNELDATIARAIQIKYVVSTTPDPIPNLQLIRTFGIFKVYRNLGYDPHRVISDSADITVTRFDDEDIRFTVRNARPGARARVATSFYPRWHAYENGRSLAISQVHLRPDSPGALMDMPVSNGEVVLRYEMLPVHYVGRAITTVAWLTVAALAWLSTRSRRAALVRARVARVWERGGRYLERATAIAYGVLPAAWLAFSHPPMGRGVAYDFREHRPAAAWLDEGAHRTPCHWAGDDAPDAHWDCSPAWGEGNLFREIPCAPQLSEAPAGSFQAGEQMSLVDAIYVPTHADASTSVRYDAVPMGRMIRGILHLGGRVPLLRPVAAQQSLSVLVDDVPVGAIAPGTAPVPFAFDTSRWAGRNARVTFTFSTHAGQAPDVCLTMAAYR